MEMEQALQTFILESREQLEDMETALLAYSGEAGPPFRFMAGQCSGPCRAGVKRSCDCR
jgi:hypothetical protein